MIRCRIPHRRRGSGVVLSRLLLGAAFLAAIVFGIAYAENRLAAVGRLVGAGGRRVREDRRVSAND